MSIPSRFFPMCFAALLIAVAAVPSPAQQREPGLYAKFDTSMGEIVVKLFEKQAPQTIKSFVDMAEGRKEFLDASGVKVKKPAYDGTVFHRVIPDFMIQGGDPTGTGTGDPGFKIPDEFDASLKFDIPGRLAMANVGDPNSGTCQFFLTDAPLPYLDGKHTIFGQVITGQDVVRKIARVPHDADDRPKQDVKLNHVVIERVEAK